MSNKILLYCALVFIYKIKAGEAPKYSTENLPYNSAHHEYNTRNR